jgi:2-phospho-L-lactate guanylyltransferase
MTTIAVLPVKPLDVAKQRLAEDLGKGTRRALVEAMVTDVLIALRRSARVDRVLVVTGDTNIEALAHGYDADTVSDPGVPSHSEAARLGVTEAIERGARRVLLVAGDCPALDPAEIDELLLRDNDGPDVVVLCDRHGAGTNGLLLTPPNVIEPSFGPGSCERHVRAGEAAGATTEVADIVGFALDVDTLDDLHVVRDALADGHGGAAHTRGMFSRLSKRG